MTPPNGCKYLYLHLHANANNPYLACSLISIQIEKGNLIGQATRSGDPCLSICSIDQDELYQLSRQARCEETRKDACIDGVSLRKIHTVWCSLSL